MNIYQLNKKIDKLINMNIMIDNILNSRPSIEYITLNQTTVNLIDLREQIEDILYSNTLLLNNYLIKTINSLSNYYNDLKLI